MSSPHAAQPSHRSHTEGRGARRTLLVTGAAGFTGRHLLRAATARGYHCIGLRRHGDAAITEAAHCEAVDLLDAGRLLEVLRAHRPDYIAHLAAVSFVAHGDLSELYQSNLIGTLNLLQAAREADVGRVLLASSANLYGNCRSLPITEGTAVAPVNHYGVSKWAMEQAAALFAEVPQIVVRPFNYTGAGQAEHFLIPKLVAAFRRRDARIELGNLDVARDFSDVRDVVEAYLRLLEHDGPQPLYNVCSGTATPLSAVIAQLQQLAGYQIEVSVNPAFVRADEIKTLYGDPALLESSIGDFRRYTLAQTLKWMLSAG